MTNDELKIISSLMPKCKCGGSAKASLVTRSSGHGESDDVAIIACDSCGIQYRSEDYAGYRLRKRFIEIGKKWKRMFIDDVNSISPSPLALDSKKTSDS
jgi:hypothetical protein